jgi:hypothetical protein
MKTEDATKYASIVFLLMIGIGTIFTAVWNMVHGQSINDDLRLVITSGITYSLTTLSINHGSTVTLKGVENGKVSQQADS